MPDHGARLLPSPRDSRVEVTLNDAQRRGVRHRGRRRGAADRRFGPRVRSLAFRVLSGAEQFIGYGAIFEAGASWSTTTRCAATTARRCSGPTRRSMPRSHSLGYDLGGAPVRAEHHAAGREELHELRRADREDDRLCPPVLPGAAVLVLGVSDRSVKTDAGFEPMDAIPHMLDCRAGGSEHGAAFWPTSDAMRALGGMEQFVQERLGGQRTTPTSTTPEGRRVAWALFDAPSMPRRLGPMPSGGWPAPPCGGRPVMDSRRAGPRIDPGPPPVLRPTP